jgi:phosphatidate cytidylyltransferase
MEKDNFKKTINNVITNVGKTVRDFSKKTNNFFDKIFTKISKLDDISNLKSRIISGVAMFIAGLLAICYSKSLFFLLIIAITILMSFEWLDLTKSTNGNEKKKWNLIGFIYILLPMFSVLKLREFDSGILLWMFAIICSTDIFAYFAGKNFNGPKLMPKISPNKTWSGLLAGVSISIIIGFLSSFMFSGGVLFFILASAFLSLLEQASDLLESKFKRIFGVKDSGNIIPGHGGVLDRLDGLMLVAPTVLLLVLIYSENFISK